MTNTTHAQARESASPPAGSRTPAAIRHTSNTVRYAMPNPTPDLLGSLVSNGMPHRASQQVTQREHVQDPPHIGPILHQGQVCGLLLGEARLEAIQKPAG